MTGRKTPFICDFVADVLLLSFLSNCSSTNRQHRGLGVHISFVRSITMDAWREDQVKKMQMGGNNKCLEFFKKSPDYRQGMSINEKYNSDFARQYREKLAAEVEGRPWTPSPAQTSSRPRPPPKNGTSSPAPGRKPQADLLDFDTPAEKSDGWDAWDSARNDPPRGARSSPVPRPQSEPVFDGSSSRGGSSINTDKARNEAYFARMGSANSQRPDGIAPSAGGKYGGFGNPNFQSQTSSSFSSRGGGAAFDANDLMGSLSKGWSMFSSTAAEYLDQGAKAAISGAQIIGQKVGATTAVVI